jgi:hypothetical protein
MLLHATASCENRDRALRVLLQDKLGNMGVHCEDMCKDMGAYPDCQCPGFAGMPASADDNRACIVKYCQDPDSPCPNDAFVTCVKSNTEVSALLQWDSIFQKLQNGTNSYIQVMKKVREQKRSKVARCQKKDLAVRVLLQEKVASLGVHCEDMCKDMGAYPDCQCPGFAGMPASADDNRACIVKYCQDPTSPCPNDAFVTCVKENTEVSALQFDTALTQIDQGFKSLIWQMKNGPKKQVVKKHV